MTADDNHKEMRVKAVQGLGTGDQGWTWLFAPHVAPYTFDEIDLTNSGVGPTFHGHHIFGTDLIGRDYFSRVIFGIRTSEKVAA